VGTVLLARPHPEIRPHMETFLKGLGFAPRGLASLDELPAKSTGLAGVVISTAVKATLAESYPEVFAAVFERFPNLPVMFATLGGVEAMRHNLEHMLRRHVEDARVVVPDDGLSKVGRREVFVLVTKADITDAERLLLAKPMVRRFFGG
jgi:hypothetical protein